MEDKFDQILPLVRKPARYVGGELHAIKKDWEKTPIKVVLAYPDTYEIGMSNLGIQILYDILNKQTDVLAERAATPWPDMEDQLTTNNLQLTTLESRKPLNEFDVLGFSLGHELTYTNVLTMLKLGGIPIYSKDRTDKDPLVMAGGPSVFNPEPVADFIDFFVIGEAEEVILEITDKLRSELGAPRAVRLAELAKIPGIYIPELRTQNTEHKVQKRYIKDFTNSPCPHKPIIPFIEAIHDRAVIEVMRGCKWGCKFCQAGWVTRPVREKKKEQILPLADELIKNTGYEEISLVSLSSSDHSEIEAIAKTLAQKYQHKRVNISLPSMRTNSFSVKLAKEIARVRSGSITIAPEAGTQRLRDVIGKNMNEEDIKNGVISAFDAGISAIKLYFMIGLPTETDEDLLALCDLAKKILGLGRQRTHRTRVTINLATFIPKPHTPLQWERQITIEETLHKQRIIKQNAKARGLEVRWHGADASFLEGVFSRGDKKLSKVIEKAWELGARLDAWSEHFKFELWEKAFAECGIDPNEYLAERKVTDTLPWDFIDPGVSKETLIRVAPKN